MKKIDGSTYWAGCALAWELAGLVLALISVIAYQPHFLWWVYGQDYVKAFIEWDLITSATVAPFVILGGISAKEMLICGAGEYLEQEYWKSLAMEEDP